MMKIPLVFVQTTPVFADGGAEMTVGEWQSLPEQHFHPATRPTFSVAKAEMFQLVYASTAVKLFSGSELLELLPRYREKNLRLGITGLLLYKHGSFMQALEGEEAAVRSLFAVIRQDPRHHHVLILMALPVAARQFPNWSMGFKDLGAAAADDVPGYDPSPALPPANEELPWQASVASNLLATFQEDN